MQKKHKVAVVVGEVHDGFLQMCRMKKHEKERRSFGSVDSCLFHYEGRRPKETFTLSIIIEYSIHPGLKVTSQQICQMWSASGIASCMTLENRNITSKKSSNCFHLHPKISVMKMSGTRAILNVPCNNWRIGHTSKDQGFGSFGALPPFTRGQGPRKTSRSRLVICGRDTFGMNWPCMANGGPRVRHHKPHTQKDTVFEM